MDEQKQTIYWRDGKRDVLPGHNGANALGRAGYGHGAVSAVDFICDGENNEYEWDVTTRQWNRRDEVDHE